MVVDLNCDLGEGGLHDADLVPLVTSVNIACGYHAGDPHTALVALELAREQGTNAGAHVGFPDREHFGRREMERPEQLVYDDCVDQIGELESLARTLNVRLTHVKPHGALYHQACREEQYARPVVSACELFGLALIGLPGSCLQKQSAGKCPFFAEGFADRRYRSDGTLVPRSEGDPFVDDPAEALEQVARLVRDHGVQTICVHGDNPRALHFTRDFRELLLARGFAVCGLALHHS